MDVDFDPAKNGANIVKHGVALSFGAVVFADPDHIVLASARPVDGEDRLKVIGMAEDRRWTAIYVIRGTVIRFISVRRSNYGEKRVYRTDG